MELITIIILGVGVVQMPLLLDLLKAMFPVLALNRWTDRTVSVVLILIVVSLCLVALSVFFSLYLPIAFANYETLPEDVLTVLLTPRGYAHIAFALFLWLNTIYHYACATWRSPGYVVSETPTTNSATGGSVNTASSDSLREEDESSRNKAECQTCHVAKVSHSHHCKDCNKCVLYMDHHCPFTMNCVGLRNYGNFYLFLLYVTLGLAYASFFMVSFEGYLTFPVLQLCWLDFTPRTKDPVLCTDVLGGMSLMFMVAISLFMCTGCLWLFQTTLLLLDWSTILLLQFFKHFDGFHTLWVRLREQRFRAEGSRMRVLLLAQRPHWWQWLIPFTDNKGA